MAMQAAAAEPGRTPESGILVGDIGGTHVRLAVVSEAVAQWQRTYRCADFPGILAAIDAYLADVGLGAKPQRVALAVAGPVIDGRIEFTNNGWRISEDELVAAGFRRAKLVNDFAALALSIPHVASHELTWLGGPRETHLQGTVAVIGPGTGFGVAALVRGPGRDVVVTTEGGHVSFAPTDEIEIEVLRYLARQFGRVSNERLLSGPGLVHLHLALAAARGIAASPLEPSEITRRARAGDADCLATVHRFCAILGSVAGDAALSFGANAGVYVTGGVAEKLADIIPVSLFRERFEAKGRFADYQKAIPAWLLVSADAAFLGAARSMEG